MGFIVTKPIETKSGQIHDEFYVRIENAILNKYDSVLSLVIGHYDSVESAKNYLGEYLEDDTHPHGQLNVSMSIHEEIETWVELDGESGSYQMISTAVDWKEYPMYYSYPIVETVLVPTEVFTTTQHSESVEYIDFDENGNEITNTRLEYYDVVTSEIVDVPKRKRNFEIITGSLYEFGYTKIKETYGELFGSENIVDLI